MPFTVKEFPNRTFDTISEYTNFVKRRTYLLKIMKARREGYKLFNVHIVKTRPLKSLHR